MDAMQRLPEDPFTKKIQATKILQKWLDQEITFANEYFFNFISDPQVLGIFMDFIVRPHEFIDNDHQREWSNSIDMKRSYNAMELITEIKLCQETAEYPNGLLEPISTLI